MLHPSISLTSTPGMLGREGTPFLSQGPKSRELESALRAQAGVSPRAQSQSQDRLEEEQSERESLSSPGQRGNLNQP